jgi:hypothetical protein
MCAALLRETWLPFMILALAAEQELQVVLCI